MMAKIKNDRSQYVRRSDVSAGAPAKLSGRHRTPNEQRAKTLVEKLGTLKNAFIDF